MAGHTTSSNNHERAPVSSLSYKTIQTVRHDQGSDLVILGHHYQSDQVVRHVDHVGDSLELAARVPGLQARRIVFCGVHFMAETAAVLAQPGQQVYLPETSADCFMANMAPAALVERILEKLMRNGRRVVPLAYVNSSAGLKAICGDHQGSVCTSANARVMLEWALDRGEHVLFLPDKHLAVNTADQLGIPPTDRTVLDIRGRGGNIEPAGNRTPRLLIWPGQCAVHARFKTARLAQVRSEHPQALVAAHPECHPELVRGADGVGSTSFLIEYAARAPLGSTIFVATECNLVERLQRLHAGQKTILPLSRSLCSGMGKTTEAGLAALLSSLDTREEIRVPGPVKESAALALNRMLQACGRPVPAKG